MERTSNFYGVGPCDEITWIVMRVTDSSASEDYDLAARIIQIHRPSPQGPSFQKDEGTSSSRRSAARGRALWMLPT